MIKVFVDIHVIQSVPPSCLNRDDTGSPKTAIYGGVRRARVSSQAWKRAMRVSFKEHFAQDKLASRTKQPYLLVAEKMIALDSSLSLDEAKNMAEKAIGDSLKKPPKKDIKTNQLSTLLFISHQQAINLAKLVLEKAAKKEIKQALIDYPGVEIALFGRMIAEDSDVNCDACCQVAHAISTHRADTEYDYFTAVDDLAKYTQDHAGGAHLGTVEFNSSTLYRYSTIAAHNLFKELNNEADALQKAITEFVRAFVTSMPTGKQNTFAAFTPPNAVFVSIRTDAPINLAGAFEKPVNAGAEGFVTPSIHKLVEYAQSVYADFAPGPAKGFVVSAGLDELGERVSLEQLLSRVGGEVAGRLE